MGSESEAARPSLRRSQRLRIYRIASTEIRPARDRKRPLQPNGTLHAVLGQVDTELTLCGIPADNLYIFDAAFDDGPASCRQCVTAGLGSRPT